MQRLLFSLALLLLPLASAAQDDASPGPSLNYIELLPSAYFEQSEKEAPLPFRREGQGVALALGWQVAEYLALTGRFQLTSSEPEYGLGELERNDQLSELALAFVAPVARSTQLLVELGLASERAESIYDAGTIHERDSAGAYAALGLRMRARWFEVDLRTAGQDFRGVRRQTHATDLRFHLTERFALGVRLETWDRDFLRARRVGLGVQVKL